MAGGRAGDFARAEPLFRSHGRLVVHVGPLGHGETVKLINNAVAAANCATVGEALLVVHVTLGLVVERDPDLEVEGVELGVDRLGPGVALPAAMSSQL